MNSRDGRNCAIKAHKEPGRRRALLPALAVRRRSRSRARCWIAGRNDFPDDMQTALLLSRPPRTMRQTAFIASGGRFDATTTCRKRHGRAHSA